MKALVYQTSVDDPEALVARIVVASGQLLYMPGVFEQTSQSFILHCNTCIKCGGGLFEHIL